jgi:hypothetical protein
VSMVVEWIDVLPFSLQPGRALFCYPLLSHAGFSATTL